MGNGVSCLVSSWTQGTVNRRFLGWDWKKCQWDYCRRGFSAWAWLTQRSFAVIFIDTSGISKAVHNKETICTDFNEIHLPRSVRLHGDWDERCSPASLTSVSHLLYRLSQEWARELKMLQRWVIAMCIFREAGTAPAYFETFASGICDAWTS